LLRECNIIGEIFSDQDCNTTHRAGRMKKYQYNQPYSKKTQTDEAADEYYMSMEQ